MNGIDAHRESYDRMMDLFRRDQLASCYLFVGPNGIGKSDLSLALIQAILCERRNGNFACGTCGSCLRLQKREHESVLIIEPENATRSMIKVEQATSVLKFLQLRSLGERRFVLIEHADRMNAAAANTLLKTLEEPDARTVFFMTAVGSRHLLPTLRSRSQMVRLRPLTVTEMKKRSGANDWALSLSRGSWSELKALTQPEEIENRATAQSLFLAWRREAQAPFTLLRDVGKDRNRALSVTHHLSLILRDWLAFLLDPGQILASDLRDVFKGLPPQSPEVVAKIALRAARLPSDLLANRDVQLVFEEFFILASRELVLN